MSCNFLAIKNRDKENPASHPQRLEDALQSVLVVYELPDVFGYLFALLIIAL